jgi:tetratricopeptide (TPR) repeat protein
MEQVLTLNATGQWAKSADLISMLQNVGVVHYRAKDYAAAAKWMERNLKEGGTSIAVKNIRVQAYAFAGDFQRASELVEEEIALAQKEDRAPAQAYLELLAQARGQLKDTAGVTRAMELLVTHYPKKQYWQSLVNRLWARPDLTPALHLDVFRLAFFTDALSETNDYQDYIDFAQRSGNSAEALTAFDKGAEAGLMGTGANVEAHKKLRAKLAAEVEQDKKTAAADAANALKKPNGVALVNVGYSLVGQGQFDKGIELLEKGIAKGLPKRPEDARLHLAIAQVLAGQTDKAKQTFATVSGPAGLDELVRYWLLAIRKP